jgi:uncharacterized tellurite resistance protein B-like protein
MFSLFGRNKEDSNKGNLGNLIALAKADGIIAGSELKYLYAVGKKLGLREEEVHLAIQDSNESDYQVPDNDADRFEHLYELIELMLVDGAIEDNEIDFCVEVAENLGFKKTDVAALVKKMTASIQKGMDKDAIKEEARTFLKF